MIINIQLFPSLVSRDPNETLLLLSYLAFLMSQNKNLLRAICKQN